MSKPVDYKYKEYIFTIHITERDETLSMTSSKPPQKTMLLSSLQINYNNPIERNGTIPWYKGQAFSLS